MEMVASMTPVQQPVSDRKLVDSIVYLASLSPKAKAIDPLLDTLRYVTARWESPAPINTEDRRALEQVVTQLKTFLIHEDPLRNFTEESLSRRLQAQLQTLSKPTWYTSGFVRVILLSLLTSGSILLLPFNLSFATRLLIAVPAFLLVSTIGVVWFYLSSLGNFKTQLRRSFLFQCTGVVGLGILFIHFVILQIFHLENIPLLRYGGLLIIGTLSVISMYMGLRVYAKLLGITTRFMSLPLSGIIWIIDVLLAIATTSLSRPIDPGYFSFSFASLLVLNITALFGAGVAYSIARNVTASYAKSMWWFFIFMTGTFIGSTCYGIVLIIQGELSGAALSNALGFFAIPPVLLLLYSGYSFKKETSN